MTEITRIKISKNKVVKIGQVTKISKLSKLDKVIMTTKISKNKVVKIAKINKSSKRIIRIRIINLSSSHRVMLIQKIKKESLVYFQLIIYCSK